MVYEFRDILTGSLITSGPDGVSLAEKGGATTDQVESIFFPGCGYLNYAPELIAKTAEALERDGDAQGMSLLCCGIMLAFEDDAVALMDGFGVQLIDLLRAHGVKRVITACPNCTFTLRRHVEQNGVDDITIMPLSTMLADRGYVVDHQKVRSALLKRGLMDPTDEPRIAIHDSCPDRLKGEFANGMRKIFPPEVIVEMEHSRSRSQCCGSQLNAVGKYDSARAQSARRAQEGLDVGAHALMTGCVSCAEQLTNNQDLLPLVHYIEILFDGDIAWRREHTEPTQRFLVDGFDGRRRFHGSTEVDAR